MLHVKFENSRSSCFKEDFEYLFSTSHDIGIGLEKAHYGPSGQVS